MSAIVVSGLARKRRWLDQENRRYPDRLVRVPVEEWPADMPPRLFEVWRSKRFFVEVFRRARSGVISAVIRPTPPSTPGTWQPIATAPKDGTRVILYKFTPPGWYIVGHGYWFAGQDGSCGWIARAFNGDVGSLGLAYPSHWMPLPHAPKNEPKSDPTPQAESTK